MADRTRAGTRLILRQQRRKAFREGDNEKAAVIGVALRDRNVFNQLLEKSKESSSIKQIRNEEGQIVNVTQALGDGEFLQWFVDNFLGILLELLGL